MIMIGGFEIQHENIINWEKRELVMLDMPHNSNFHRRLETIRRGADEITVNQFHVSYFHLHFRRTNRFRKVRLKDKSVYPPGPRTKDRAVKTIPGRMVEVAVFEFVRIERVQRKGRLRFD